MRDLVIVAVVFGLLPLVVLRPWIGILLFCWISFMNPHKLSYGFASGFPFAQIIALVTIISAFFWKDRNKLPKSAPVILLLAFLAWQIVTTLYAFFPDEATDELIRTLKIYLMVVISLMLISRPKYLIHLVWVVAFSIGFFGIKGGVFSILTGGSHLIWGPAGTFIEGNNEIGLAMLMVLPMFVFLAGRESRPWVKRALYVCSTLILISVVTTYSRGAFLGMICMGLFLWLKSSKKLISVVVAFVFGGCVFAFMPQTWFDRMNTTTDYENDGSAMGRINAWIVAYDVAISEPTGGGYQMLSYETTYQAFGRTEEMQNIGFAIDAHSIYFEVLGEHGFIGLFIFLAFIITSWRQGTWVIKQARGSPELADIANLCRMLQVSMIAYLSAGAFLGLASFDLFYQIVAILVLAKFFVARHLSGLEYSEWLGDGEADDAGRVLVPKTRSISSWLPTHVQ